MRKLIAHKKFMTCVTLALISMVSFAQPGSRTQLLNLEKGLALQGYDPVAYFIENKSVEGRKEISANVNNVTYYFSSNANKALFEKDPQKYEPQFGGWCAYAMGATGEKVEVDPETFKIVNGKLYLFYNKFFNNTLPKWNADEANLKAKAEKNWDKIFR